MITGMRNYDWLTCAYAETDVFWAECANQCLITADVYKVTRDQRVISFF